MTSSPRLASKELSAFPLPLVNPPPWMWTMTGRLLVGVAVTGAHTLTNRQFSLPAPDVCVHSLPKAVAGNVVVHAVGGWGGLHRRRPTGGAAYGIPSHSLTPRAVVLVRPQTCPYLVWTVVPGAQVSACARAALADGPAVAIA